MTTGPQLKVEGKHAYQTFLGGIINIILLIISIIGSIYFGQELWVRKEPIVMESFMEAIDVGPFPINSDSFNILMGLTYHNNTFYINDRVVHINATIEVNYFFKNGSQLYTINPLEVDLCNKYYTNDDIHSTASIDVNFYYCIKPNATVIDGFWGSTKTNIIHVSIYKCVNSTENNNKCASEEEINQINMGFLSMFVTNTFLTLNDPITPVQYKYVNVFNSINFDLTFQYSFKLSNFKVLDDKGFLLQSISETDYPHWEPPQIFYFGRRDLIAEVFLTVNSLAVELLGLTLKSKMF